MKENEIRRSDLAAETQRLYKIDQQNILELKDMFVEVDCPCCHASQRELAWERDGFRFNECCNCQSIYVSPRPTPEILSEHYRTSLSEAFWIKEIYPNSEQARREKIVKPRVEKVKQFVEKYGVARSRLIDVGAGFGTFCHVVSETGLFNEVIAVEPNLVPGAEMLHKGVSVINDRIENLSNLNADVITSFELIEHLFAPCKFIEKLYAALNPGGLLVITTPNIQGFDLATLRNVSDNTTAPDHINYFHIESLKSLLEAHSFNVLEVLTPGKLDAELVRNKVLAGVYDLSGQHFLKTVLIDNWEKQGQAFQQYLEQNLLSSHLWMVARKPSE